MFLLDIAKNFAIACLIFIPLERLLPFHRGQKVLRRDWKLDLTHVAVTGPMIALGGAVVFVVGEGLRRLVPGSVHAFIAGQPFWLSFLQVLLIADFGFYWVHRLFHAVPALWRIHAVHHSIESLDFVAGHRVHPFDQIATRCVTLLPVYALAYPPAVVLAWLFVYHWQSLFLHSNIMMDGGPLRRIIALPVYHHWHHAREPEAMDKNFAGQLSFWDALFGTLYLPKDKLPQSYGSDTPVASSYVEHMISPFRREKAEDKAQA